jgi:hypothetical protein
MKQIERNSYFRSFDYNTEHEALMFVKNLNTLKHLHLSESFGDRYFCYVNYDCITKEKQFVISFGTYEKSDNLKLMWWNKSLLVDTGSEIYLIDENLHIKVKLDIYASFIGFFLINESMCLCLGEINLWIINMEGEILRSESYHLINSLEFSENDLTIKAENKDLKIDFKAQARTI